MRAERALAMIVACAAVLASCREREEAPEAKSPKTVRCAPVITARVVDRVELRGTVSPLPDRDAQVAPQVAGRILEVLVREGDSVRAGQVLARIDAAPLEDQAHGTDAALARAEAERKAAEATHERLLKVFEHGIAARQEVDDAAARVAAARAQEAEAKAAAQRANREVDRATVKSPLAGVVLRLLKRTGELVDGTPATPLAEVADPSRLELVSDASIGDLVRVTRGDRATITVSALPQTWTGTVSAVSPAVDRATGLGTVRVAIDLVHGRLPVGALGTAHIAVGEAREALLVPKEALRVAEGAKTAVIVCGKDGLAHAVEVERGVAQEGRVEAGGELKAGDRVAVEPVLGIEDGDKLEEKP